MPRRAGAADAGTLPPSSGSQCLHTSVVTGQTEAVFWPKISFPTGVAVLPGATVGSWYSDETHVYNPTVPTDLHFDRRIHFQLSKVSGSTSTVVFDYLPAKISKTIDNTAKLTNNERECYYQELLTATVPNVTDAGHYRMDLTAWDSDFLAAGHDTTNDFGHTSWEFDIIAPGTLTGAIQDCAGAAAGGSITGKQGANVVGTPGNPLTVPGLAPGPYDEVATAPTHFHFTNCATTPSNDGTSATKTGIVVPAGGSNGWVFHVAPDAGNLTGYIKDCAGTPVAGGTIGASGTQAVANQNDSLTATVAPGSYIEHATAPSHYHFTDCATPVGSNAGAAADSPTLPVEPGGTNTHTFNVAQNPGHIQVVINLCDANGAATTTAAPAGGAATIPNTTASGSPVPVTVDAAPGTYAVTATSPQHYSFCSGTGTQNGVSVTPDNTTTVTFLVKKNPGQVQGVIFFCNADGTVGSAASGTITIAGTTLAAGGPAPATTTAPDGSVLNVVASNPPAGDKFVNCGGKGGGAPSTGGTTATLPATVITDTITKVTFFVAPIPVQQVNGVTVVVTPPAQGVQAAQAAQGVQGASTQQPNTGHGDAINRLLLAFTLVLFGISVLLARDLELPELGRLSN
ncbi:MAG: hypothetical protein ACR2MY_11120 [Candidatus Dormibacteria bacterium]